MNMISRDERKKQKGIKKLIHSFTFPIKGLKYAYRNEQNLAVDVGISILVLIASFILKLNTTEWVVVIFTIGAVLSLELVNTAIEATVDLVTEEYHPLAKVAKDTSAAAVFIIAIVAMIIGIIIFLPKIIDLL